MTSDGTYSLTKGQEYSLTKRRPALRSVTIGLGWRTRTTAGAAFDLDASAIVLGANKKVLGDGWFVFFNHPESPDGSVKSAGDNLVGSTGDDDDEQIMIDLDALPPAAQAIVIPVSMYDAEQNGQDFGQVQRAYVRVVDNFDGTELARYDLVEESSINTAIVFGELFREHGGWGFRAVGRGYRNNLASICAEYGVRVGS